MTSMLLVTICSVGLALTQAMPAFAQAPDWLSRCSLALGVSSAPETGKYLFMTRGKVSEPAQARLDYSTSVSARAATYPTAAKDLLNPYSSPSVTIGYYGAVAAKAPYAVKAAIGHVSFGSIGKDFKTIPGAPVQVKLVIDGVTFGPYEPNPSSLSSGMYSVWLDTAATDGDSKPPRLSAPDFAKLAKAVDAMKSAEVVLVQGGADIVRTTIPAPNRTAWRDGLAPWASKTKPGVGEATNCSGGGDILH